MSIDLDNTIDWARMHRPQADGYDTQMVKALAVERYKFAKRVPVATDPTMFKGKVVLVHQTQKAAPYLDNAPFDHPNLKKTEDFLYAIWPEIAVQCEELIQSIWILLDNKHAVDAEVNGCTCGNTSGFGGICTTIQGTLGFAHGIVHEHGHHKMHAMGVHLEAWDNLVANAPTELFESPIRKDKPRPMGACIQAQYSYLHVLEMEIRAFKAGKPSDMMALNITRMKAGQETLKAWKPDKNGEAFAVAMDNWCTELVTEGEALLKKT